MDIFRNSDHPARTLPIDFREGQVSTTDLQRVLQREGIDISKFL